MQSESNLVYFCKNEFMKRLIVLLMTVAFVSCGSNENNIEAKRKSFQMISDNMYDLLRTVRYDNEIVYHQYCPMAFNDAGAYWLSKTGDIKNPYFGKKM